MFTPLIGGPKLVKEVYLSETKTTPQAAVDLVAWKSECVIFNAEMFSNLLSLLFLTDSIETYDLAILEGLNLIILLDVNRYFLKEEQ